MEATIDSVGRIVVPKALRDELGLVPGTKVDVSRYGDGLHLQPGGRTARLVTNTYGRLVARSETTFDDDDLYSLIDAGRR